MVANIATLLYTVTKTAKQLYTLMKKSLIVLLIIFGLHLSFQKPLSNLLTVSYRSQRTEETRASNPVKDSGVQSVFRPLQPTFITFV